MSFGSSKPPPPQIIETPPGKNDESIRKEWTGLILQYVSETDTHYEVRSRHALRKLRRNKKRICHAYYTKLRGGTFGFPKRCCKKI